MTSSARLPRASRLARASDIRRCLTEGRRRRFEHLDMIWMDNTTGHARMGLIVPKFRSSAVARNRLRRRLREIWWCELPEIGRRPVVVLSRDSAIPRLRRAIVGPCTTTVRGLPSEVRLEPGQDPVPKLSAVGLDSTENVPVGSLVERLGRLSDERMHEICEALAVAVACEP